MSDRRLPSQAGDAVRDVLVALLEAMRRHQAATIAGHEPDALHDFRVAVRRTRVAMGRMKAALDPEIVHQLRPEFAWLGKITGPARDLDVFFEQLSDRSAGLKPADLLDRERLVERLSAERDQAHRRLAVALEGDRYRDLTDAWSDYLHRRSGLLGPPLAREPVERAAGSWIRKARRGVAKRGRTITSESPPKALHRLRIECKKLRYLLEFFRSLDPIGSREAEIRALKRVQDSLGALNDCRVQRSILKQMVPVAGDQGVEVSMKRALQRLLAELDAAWAAERLRFDEIFERFSAES